MLENDSEMVSKHCIFTHKGFKMSWELLEHFLGYYEYTRAGQLDVPTSKAEDWLPVAVSSKAARLNQI